MEYRFSAIEKKWQEYWAEKGTFQAHNEDERPKYYVLDMFPYPSGAGLHVGHPLGYIASDIVARYKRHQGYNVLHPMGYDSFGLPAEQYAIQTGQHPAITTKENIARYRQQLDQIGFAFDWSREVRTSDPQFYRWTQWIFLQLFDSWYDREADQARPIDALRKHFAEQGTVNCTAFAGEASSFTAEQWQAYSEAEQEQILQHYRLAYRTESTVNWCPALGTVLANDEVKEGLSERGGHPVVQKKMMQWSMRITAYAQRLLDGLEKIDWPEPLKEAQRHWIGRSEGASVHFSLPQRQEKIEVFTTRPDTIFGVSFMVLAPEHPLVGEITTKEQAEAVEAYVKQAARKSERDRMSDVKTVSGAFTGAYALHPFSGERLPIWIADYVLASYGTGAVMAVPAHDARDWAFAEKFDLAKPQVIAGGDIAKAAYEAQEGELMQSDFLNGLRVPAAIVKAIQAIEQEKIGESKVNFRLRDAIFGRQRYWGEPIPIYFEGSVAKAVRNEHLPLPLPEVDAYLPTEDGEPPLARAKDWYYHPEKGLCAKAEGFPLETTTMPGWAGSSWYDLRYMDPGNTEALVGLEALDYWQDVDLYIGGSEHATGHLLYTRFWHKFLVDRGWSKAEEPFKKLINQGMITGSSAFVHRESDSQKLISADQLAGRASQAIHADVSMVDLSDNLDLAAFKDWRDDLALSEVELNPSGEFKVSREVEKMSKSKYNVVNPDDIIAEFGADTLRMYEMFLGPLEQSKPWNTAGITGVHNFLKKLWRLYHQGGSWNIAEGAASAEELKVLHTLIKKLNEDIGQFSFNTSVSAFMIAVNGLHELNCNKRSVLRLLPVLISPFAPHIAEEIWQQLGEKSSVAEVPYPQHEEQFLVESQKKYPVSFNGKVRFTVELPADLAKDEIEAAVMGMKRTQAQLAGGSPKKVIVVPGKIVNIVV